MGSARWGCGKASPKYYGIIGGDSRAEMESSTKCYIVGGDGVTVVADKKMLAQASTFFRDILSTRSHLEDQVIQLPSLDSKMLELMIEIMEGKACVDVMAAGNKAVREAAELIGIVPPSIFDISDFNDQVTILYYSSLRIDILGSKKLKKISVKP